MREAPILAREEDVSMHGSRPAASLGSQGPHVSFSNRSRTWISFSVPIFIFDIVTSLGDHEDDINEMSIIWQMFSSLSSSWYLLKCHGRRTLVLGRAFILLSMLCCLRDMLL